MTGTHRWGGEECRLLPRLPFALERAQDALAPPLG